ncbi:MAG TPA: glycerophosphodiester phosphodiesterase family protein [Alphaproteobacteria bacterium]|nr:glycerophosphodiester phosphodiesterase family protein [Alphaproteobacteria bacterium]
MPTRPSFDKPIAHRGLHDRADGIIENSMTAFAAAIERGYAIECDVQLSRDGIAVIFHDDNLDRLTGVQGPVIARDAAELTRLPLTDSKAGDCLPLFADLLKLTAGRVLLQIELKRQLTPDATRMLAQRVMDGLRDYHGPVALESFDPNLLVALRRAGCTAPLGIITYAYDEPTWDRNVTPAQKFVLRHLLHWPVTRFDFISCRDRSLDLPAVRLFRALGTPVTTWTVQSSAAALAVLGKSDQIVFEGFLPQSA